MKCGKVSQAVLDRSVLRPLYRKGAAGETDRIGADGQLLADDWMCASVMAEYCGAYDLPLDMHLHAVRNNLAVEGADLLFISLGIMLGRDTQEDRLLGWMEEAAGFCNRYTVRMAGGHTERAALCASSVISITGYGKRTQQAAGSGGASADRKAHAGMQLVMAGCAGQSGTGILAYSQEEMLRKRFPAFLVDEALSFAGCCDAAPAARIAREEGVTRMHDISQGGVFGALWEFGEKERIGFLADLKKIPVRQETIEICEIFDLNPYQLYGQGGLLMLSDRGIQLCGRFASEGIRASILGTVTEGCARIIRNGEEERYLDRPGQDMLWKMRGADIQETDRKQMWTLPG